MNILNKALFFIISMIRPLFGPISASRCYFNPSCGKFALQQLESQPLSTALFRSGQQLLKCNPLYFFLKRWGVLSILLWVLTLCAQADYHIGTATAQRAFAAHDLQAIKKSFASLQRFHSTYFNEEFLESSRVYPYLYSRKENISRLKIPCKYGTPIHATYFNRNSDILVIVGHGFTSCKEKMFSYAALYPEYDIVCFDWPGHGQDCYNNDLWQTMSKQLTGTHINKLSFGPKEIEYVCAVRAYCCEQKSYSTIVGVSICYAAFYFVQAAIEWKKHHTTSLFDKLILDSPWLDHHKAIKRLPHLKQWYGLNKTWIVEEGWFWCVYAATSLSQNALAPLTQYLKQLTECAVLFVHNPTDPLCTVSEFYHLIKKTSVPAAYLFVPSFHARHHKDCKEVYASITQQFIEKSFHDFKGMIEQEI